MSEHARRNLVCSSWHKLPKGLQAWSGMMSGYTTRPFCWDAAGHAGDHWAAVSPVDGPPATTKFTWPNKTGMPVWLVETTIHGLKMLGAHETRLDPEKLKNGRIRDVIAALEAKLPDRG